MKGCISSQNLVPTFICKGYTNWKDATCNNGWFKLHRESECHKEALERTVKLPMHTEDIGETLSSAHSDKKALSRKCLLKMLSNVRLLARQALPLRGSKDGEQSNFQQPYYLRGEDNPFLRDWLTRKGDRYIHGEIQNEMMKIMALKVLREIPSDIRNAEFFSILVDETTDVSNKTQLVLCIRWVDDDLNVFEDFIGLYKLDETNSNAITSVIKDALTRMNLSLNRCRGQNYDGCSTMKGERNGVARQIKDEEKRAIYIHCFTHSLNLAVGD